LTCFGSLWYQVFIESKTIIAYESIYLSGKLEIEIPSSSPPPPDNT
jgi:hypothetical protein